jgi:hypothetical protein
MAKWKYEAFAFGNDLWDPSHRFETSWLLPPWFLFGIRAAIVGRLLLAMDFANIYAGNLCIHCDILYYGMGGNEPWNILNT